MLQFSMSEMLLVAIVAIIFIGPKELPQVIRCIKEVRQHIHKLKEQISNQINLISNEDKIDAEKHMRTAETTQNNDHFPI